MSESDLEKPEPDSAEPSTDAEDPEAPLRESQTSLPLEVNEADAVEQHREVELDEDDYR
jgi:hypothetical protein